MPLETLKPILRIQKGKPSYKILIVRPGDQQRILCAEISEAADNPGADIFQDGALLGTYDFQNRKDFFDQLTKIIRVHLWQKEKWTIDDHKQYTLNWFEKVLDLSKGTVAVEKAFSFFHSPTLIKSDRIDALFLLISEVMERRLADPEDPLRRAAISLGREADAAVTVSEKSRLADLLDQAVFELLTVVKDFGLFAFDTMTNREADQFNRESARIQRKLTAVIEKKCL